MLGPGNVPHGTEGERVTVSSEEKPSGAGHVESEISRGPLVRYLEPIYSYEIRSS